MKTPKSSDSEEITPSKKVLKQARLPFTTKSDVSPKSAPKTPQSRKRKLSVPDTEPIIKLGKIAKKDEIVDILVISDDDSNTAAEVKTVSLQVNPIVKLVDTAWKKKLQKAKDVKKKKGNAKKSSTVTNGCLENNENACNSNENDNIECVKEMEIDDADISIKEDSKDNQVTDVSNVIENNIVEVENKSKNNEFLIKSNTKPNNILAESNIFKVDANDVKAQKSIQNSEKLNIKSEELMDIQEANKQEESPKKSERIKSNTEGQNLDTSITSNCDESFSSDLSTPRRSNRKVSLTNSQGDVTTNDSTSNKLTPKQLQKKLESAKKKDEREKERLEKEKKKQLDKEEREKQKREKDDQKKREREEKEEAKKKEREEKEEQKRKEKEDKEKQRELEKKVREEKEEQKRKEKEDKEEQRKKEKEAKEEEKRKKQEAIEQEKLEQEQKKKKAADAFVSFFVPKQKLEKDQVTIRSVSKNDMLSSFTIKSDMRLAPTTRVTMNDNSKLYLDNLLLQQNVPEKSLYIKSLKERKPLTDLKTWPLSDKDDDVMIVEDELPPPMDGIGQIITCDSVSHEKLKPKLLAFHDNRRPPYWGTWRKKSTSIKPRQPFKTDKNLLDYEVDSDEDWEEEQDGESIDGSAAGSDDEQDADEYEVDNEVFVPHGYLSDEEATMDEDDVLTLSPEKQKARLKHLEDEFENEMKKPTEKLKPWFYGLSWETEDGGKPENCAQSVWEYFQKFAMIMDDPTPLLQPSIESVEPEKKKVKKKKVTEREQSPKTEKKKKSKIEEKDGKKQKADNKKANQDTLKNQPGINAFLKKLKTS